MNSVWKSRQEGDLNPEVTDDGPIPGPIRRLLQGRGLTETSQIEEFLFPKLQNLKDPFSLLNMDLAVARLVRAYQNQEKLAIYADFDLDGTSGLALMMTALKKMGFENLVPYQPARLAEGYGFHPEAVEALAQDQVSLIITVDVGITAVAAAAKAREIGVDVIITDHHLPSDPLPAALTIVNPNQSGDTSGLGYLSGAGVAFYVLRALKRELAAAGNLLAKEFDLKDVLEFFTIATLTDMVPLVGDNRVLVKHGLIKLSRTDKPGLQSLKGALGLDGRPLSSQDIAIRLAPKLNALSRMGSEILPIEIMMCESLEKAQSLITRVLDNNQLRVDLQSSAEAEIQDYLATAENHPFVFMVSPRFHRGLVGLLATKMAQESQKPSFVGALDEATGTVVGSARRPPDFSGCLVEVLTSAQAHLKRFGGHSQAAGFEFSFDQYEDIHSALRAHFEKQSFSPSVKNVLFDTDLKFQDISPLLMKWLEFLGPFGVQFEAPLFYFHGVKLQSQRELRGGHLRLTFLHAGEHQVQEALLFSPSRAQKDILAKNSTPYDILGELQWNYYNGEQKVQLLIKDIRVSLWQ